MLSIPCDETKITDLQFFSAFNLNYKPLSKIKVAVESKQWDIAKQELITYFKNRQHVRYLFDYRQLPLQPMEVDSVPYYFQSALGLDGSLKEFCLYVADKMLQNIYVLPGKGRGEVFLGDDLEQMIHFNFLLDQKKKHRHSLDMFVRGQFFESLAVAYHQTGEQKYLVKFEQMLHRFFETYPLQIVDQSPSANRFQFDEDRDVMSVGWLCSVYISLFYTRLPYEISADLAFEILKRIWFLGIQFRRFDQDSYRPYNHHLWERGLMPFLLGTLLPEIPDFVAMKKQGATVTRRHVMEDFNAVGGYNEHSIAYWSGAALGEMLTKGLIIARQNNEKLLDKKSIARIGKSFQLLAQIAPPGERYPTLGDNRGPMVTPILRLGSTALAESWCQNLLDFRESNSPVSQAIPLDYCNDAAGFVCSRNNFSPQANYFLMSTKNNCGYTGHNHMDMLSVFLTIGGEDIIGEPYAGKLYHNVTMGSRERGYMYNMDSHNTVLAYGQPIQPSEMYANKWGVYRPDSPVAVFQKSDAGIYINAFHTGYTFCLHRREVYFQRNSGWLFCDTIERGNRFNRPHIQRWHLMPETNCRLIAENALLITKKSVKLLFLWSGASDLKIWKNTTLCPHIFPDESTLSPIIDVTFQAPADCAADNGPVTVKTLILDISQSCHTAQDLTRLCHQITTNVPLLLTDNNHSDFDHVLSEIKKCQNLLLS